MSGSLLGFPAGGLSLSPTGTLAAQTPDNGVAGGSPRGANAVDLQTTRTASTQVASGAASVVAGGQSNTAAGVGAASLGGSSNNAASNNSVVAGGSSNLTTNDNAGVFAGASNIANGGSAVVLGGVFNNASGLFSYTLGGQRAATRGIHARGAWAGNRIAADGDAQCGQHVLLRQTTDATATRLTADGAAPGAANQIVLPNFGRYGGILTVVAGGAGANKIGRAHV